MHKIVFNQGIHFVQTKAQACFGFSHEEWIFSLVYLITHSENLCCFPNSVMLVWQLYVPKRFASTNNNDSTELDFHVTTWTNCLRAGISQGYSTGPSLISITRCKLSEYTLGPQLRGFPWEAVLPWTPTQQPKKNNQGPLFQPSSQSSCWQKYWVVRGNQR